ncbi:MAG: V-type ATP synthase subunit D [bacterium]
MQQIASATRMELLKQKKRAVLARRGHKLLKDKQDELMRQFLILIEDYRQLRRRMEELLEVAFQGFIVARGSMPPEFMEACLLTAKDKVKITPGKGRVLNISTLTLDLDQSDDLYSYGFSNSSGELDEALKSFAEALPYMIKLAAKERTIALVAQELETTRRRVNALEHVLIPNLESSVKQIRMRLEELERSALTRLMKVKDMLTEKEAA